jgi:hypothetical protein
MFELVLVLTHPVFPLKSEREDTPPRRGFKSDPLRLPVKERTGRHPSEEGNQEMITKIVREMYELLTLMTHPKEQTDPPLPPQRMQRAHRGIFLSRATHLVSV